MSKKLTDAQKAKQCADAFKPLAKLGRPPEGRKRFVVHILPLARKRIKFLMDKKANTPGKVIEAAFGVKP